jgi:decaprenylphospho-beta-D-ribofuranose 2-oxidase
LTGIILQAALKLKKIETGYIRQKNIKARNIDEIMDLFEKHENTTYSVAWIDCLSGGRSLGRSILMLGEHALLNDIKDVQGPNNPLGIRENKKYNIPFNFPSFVLNQFTVKAFNSSFYATNPKENNLVTDYDSFFYPLDYINNWNRIYGSRGFTQYQFVIPKDVALKGLKKILNKISQRNKGSFLAVLKLMGDENYNLISFPMKGYTLALDFPITPDLFLFLDELDRIVLEYGGRIYLSKDARMGKDMFKKSYVRSAEFISFKHDIDKENRLQSLQSGRLGI